MLQRFAGLRLSSSPAQAPRTLTSGRTHCTFSPNACPARPPGYFRYQSAGPQPIAKPRIVARSREFAWSGALFRRCNYQFPPYIVQASGQSLHPWVPVLRAPLRPVCPQQKISRLSIHLAAVPDPVHNHHAFRIIHCMENPIVALTDSIGICALEFLAVWRARVGRKPPDSAWNALPIRRKQVPDFALGATLDKNAIAGRHA